jgi:hypothetical protein
MFEIHFDENQHLLTVTIEGFWTIATFDQYSTAMRSKMRGLKRRIDHFHMLGRAVDLPIQSPEIVAGFGKLTAELIDMCPGRIAIVAGSMLNKVQASRALSHPHFAVFLDETEARNWLFADEGAHSRRIA